jgi:O-succinylbenzoate synthase
MAKAGMELALWDLKARKAGLPLWKLYGGDKSEVVSGVSVGIQNNLPQLLERIDSFLQEGYPRVKIKIKPGWDLYICREVRKHHPNIPLQVDANAAYTLADRDTLKKMDEFGLEMLEQPFFSGDLWDHSLLQKEIQTPLCLDESAVSCDAVRQAHAMQSCRIINIKVGRVGGIREAIGIHNYCLENDMPVWCGGMMESGIGRAHNLHLASLPNFKMSNDISASKRYYAEDLIDPPVELTTWGTIKVPDEPGIGVSPQEDRIKKATLHHQVFKPGI